jgi:RNA polymerase sigma-70 factor (ECF subfamily)
MYGKELGLVGVAARESSRSDRPTVTMAELPEPRLIELAEAGDRAAWNELIARHDHRVVVSLVARGRRLADARELAQSTWARLIAQQRAGRLLRLDLPGLAVRQAAFLALDAARAERAHRRATDDSKPDHDVADPAASAEDRLIRREELVRVHAELLRCAPHERRLIALLYGDPGMPHAEAARRLGLSVQRVRQTLCEVRARLRSALETESDHD